MTTRMLAIGVVLAAAACGGRVASTEATPSTSLPEPSDAKVGTAVEPEAAPLPPEEAPQAPSGVDGLCYTITEGKILRLDLASGAVIAVGTARASDHDLSSIGLFRTSQIVSCPRGPNDEAVSITRHDLTTGKTSSVPLAAGRSCTAVTADERSIYVLDMRRQRIEAFPDFDAVTAGQPTLTIARPHASRLGTRPGGLVAAWHAASEVTLYDAAGRPSTADLDGFYGWIHGVTEHAGNLLVVGNNGQEARAIHVFDATTRARKGLLFPGAQLHGIACAP